ncbi:MAG: hypothetical protein JXB33_06945, partial [Clostridia bacterium]|nr:hypothetical protein [Clostridia bacterium]
MVKRIMLVLVSLSLVLSFSACNKNGTIEESQGPSRTPIPVIDDGLPDLDAEVLLRYVNPNIDAMDDEYPYLEAWSDVIYDKFGVDVKVSFLPLYKVMKETIEELYVYDFLRVNPQEGMLLHELTDVDISYNIMKSLMEDGGILPLTDYIKNSQFYGSFDSDLL